MERGDPLEAAGPLTSPLDHAVGGEEDTCLRRRSAAKAVQLLVGGQNGKVVRIKVGLLHDGLDLVLPSDADQGRYIGVGIRGEERPEEADDGGGLADARVEAGEVDERRTPPVSHPLHRVSDSSEGDPHGL